MDKTQEWCLVLTVWTQSTISERQAYVEYLLERLELKDPAQRFASARKLLYIAQGTSNIVRLI
jgi:hypothetical protein